MLMNSGTFKYLIAVAIAVVFPAQLFAAEIEEVVVTATKRGETDIQSIAGGVHALAIERAQGAVV